MADWQCYTWQIARYIIGHVICLILLCYLRSCRRAPSLLASLLVRNVMYFSILLVLFSSFLPSHFIYSFLSCFLIVHRSVASQGVQAVRLAGLIVISSDRVLVTLGAPRIAYPPYVLSLLTVVIL